VPNETELKLALPVRRLHGIVDLAWLKKLERAAPQTENLVSVYFDTAKRALRDRHLALRVRHIGDKYLQTVKCGTSAVDRAEWEKEISGQAPDRALARKTALKPFAAKKRWRKLRAVFETRVKRTSIPLRYRKALIELALDEGEVRAGDHSQPISEIELELKDGDRTALAELARRLAEAAPVEFCLQSKMERGYALADDEESSPVKASPVWLTADQNQAEGFTIIALNCLRDFTANRAAILKGDPEGVHQMRVGVRRLRTALSLFKDLLQGAETGRIKENLKWLSGQLEPAREFDVFLEDEIAGLEQQNAHAPIKTLKGNLEMRRDQGMIQAKRMVCGDRYRRIVLETGLWAMAGEWRRSDDEMQAAKRARSLPDAAADILKKRTRKVLKKLKRLDELDAMGRHKLRIAVKKLRYATEFFAALHAEGKAKKERKAFAARLKSLQSALGRLNDIHVHEEFARKQVGKGKAGEVQVKRAFGLGFVTGREREARRVCLAGAAQAGKRFAREPHYWT
jgi:inorganic triphosphatase YgiF